ncbi:MAG: ribosome maturation factor RimP [Armatimonadota bacterium]|nr:ribosome maturation factor RimP [Armatimonadota bacterium]
MNIRKHPVVRKIEAEVEQTVGDFGYELVQLKYGGEAGGKTLSILIDRPKGVSAEDCCDMSRRLSMLLDTLDPIPSSYTLIVSSPGLDRPLTRDSDLERFEGEMAAVRHPTGDGGWRTDTGVLRGVQDGEVIMDVDGETLRVPLAEIEEAHLVYDWDAEEAQ